MQGDSSPTGAVGWSFRPAVLLALLLMLGIVLHPHLPHRPEHWLIMMGLALAGAMLAFRHALIASLLIGLAIVLAGIAGAQLQAYWYPTGHIGAYTTDQRRLAQVELHVTHAPRIVTTPFGTFRNLPPKQVFVAEVRRVHTWSGWVPSHGRILVQISQPHPRLAIGQTIRVIGLLERPGPAMNPGQFDWAEYYRDQRVLSSIAIDEAGAIHILDSRAPSLLDRSREQARRLLAMGFTTFQSLDHALLRALLLGDHDPELRDVQEDFKRTGTGHHIAISGMHVAILGGFVFLICRLMLIGPKTSAWIGMAFVVLYGLMALPSPPVVRSVLLCVSFAAGLMFRRSLDGVQLLSVSVIVMLLYQPLDLYNAGFQLSFGTVLGLMLMTRLMTQYLQEWLGRLGWPQAPLPDNPANATRIASFKHWVRRSFLTALAAGIVAWAVSLPLIAYHFGQLNPWAIPASLILSLPVMLALVGGMLKVLLTLILPGLSDIWATTAALPVAWMRHWVDWLAQLPGADVPIAAPPIWAIALYYLLLTTPLWRGWLGLPVLRSGLRIGPAAAGVLAGILPFTLGAADRGAEQAPLRLTTLAVGAGACHVIELPGGKVALLDAGSITLGDVMRRALGPYLRHRAHRSIDQLILSHANYDHFSAATDIITAYQPDTVVMTPQFRLHARGNPPAEGLLDLIDREQLPVELLQQGQSISLDAHTSLQVLWPPENAARLSPDQRPLDANNASAVLMLRIGAARILFTGDIQDDAMRELLKSPEALSANVLIAPHHGSRETLTESFIAAVNPSIILASNARSLSLKQREFDRLMAGRPFYRTHLSGAITLLAHPDGRIEVQPFLTANTR